MITGTNRNTTPEEIIASANIESEDEWVQIHVVGVDTIKTVLSRIPPNKFVCWLGMLHSGEIQEGINIMFPPEEITDAIEEYAGE